MIILGNSNLLILYKFLSYQSSTSSGHSSSSWWLWYLWWLQSQARDSCFQLKFGYWGFFDWLDEVESFFEIMEVSKECKVAIVAYKLKRRARAWWQSTCDEHYRLRQPPIRDWIFMKDCCNTNFLLKTIFRPCNSSFWIVGNEIVRLLHIRRSYWSYNIVLM